MKPEQPVQSPSHRDEGLEDDSIRDFSSHTKKEPEEEDAIRRLPDYLLVGAILVVSFLAIGVLHVFRSGSIPDTLASFMPVLALAYLIVGFIAFLAGAFSKNKKIMNKIGFILFTAAAVLLVIAAALQFILRIVLS
jgi:heme/copper-type cytochrome/quinol oxidase subunit 4